METELGEICHEGKKNAMLIFFFYFPRGFLYHLILFYIIFLFFLYSNMQNSDHTFVYNFTIILFHTVRSFGFLLTLRNYQRNKKFT